MKRRIASVFMVCALLFALAMPAFAAAGFDESVFANAGNITHNGNFYDVETIIRKPIQHKRDGRAFGCDKNYFYIYPYIAVTEAADYYIINLDLYQPHDTQLSRVPTVCFRVKNSAGKTTDHYFSLSEELKSKRYDSGVTRNSMYLYLNSSSFAMLEEFGSAKTVEVLMQDSSIADGGMASCFTLTAEEVDGIVYLYNLYKAAGGMREDNLNTLQPLGTPYSRS